MIRLRDDRGAIGIGFVHGPLFERLARGEPVRLERYVDPGGLEHPALVLDFSGGPGAVERLRRGERVCVPAVLGENGALVHPHICLFLRETNAELIAAADEYWPRKLPGAHRVHVSAEEPT
jgi:hypothetical protein